MEDVARALIGRTLGGRFRLTSYIGEGAMAVVFRGEQDSEPRQVAIKVMHRGLAGDRSFVRRFEREAKAAASIVHRNTVRIFEHGFDRDLVYIAMELIAGQDLFNVLVRERRLKEARAVRIVLQICAALDAAHRRGVVHRDLKPENIMLVRDPADPDNEVVKVLDFGIAKLMDQERRSDQYDSRADSVITLVGAVVGTPEYMSPEQARGSPPVDARSDVYACGVLLYQLVTGKLPFFGESAINVVLQHVEKEPPPPSSHVPGLHRGLERAILKALAKWPADRQQSAAELAAELGAVLPELDLGGRPHQAPEACDAGGPHPTLPGLAPSRAATLPMDVDVEEDTNPETLRTAGFQAPPPAPRDDRSMLARPQETEEVPIPWWFFVLSFLVLSVGTLLVLAELFPPGW